MLRWMQGMGLGQQLQLHQDAAWQVRLRLSYMTSCLPWHAGLQVWQHQQTCCDPAAYLGGLRQDVANGGDSS